MPELSRFGGMVIYMLFMDTKQHNKPHVHVYYGDYEAAVGIDGELLAGALPKTEENDMNDTTKQGTQGSSGMNPKKFPTSSLTADKTA